MKYTLRNVFIIRLLIITSLISISACTKKEINTTKQGDDNWVVFDINASELQKKDNVWTFELSKPGKYDIQILSKLSESSPDDTTPPKVKVLINDKLIEGPFNQTFRIIPNNKPVNVFQFKEVYQFKKAGKHTLTFTVDESVAKIRLIPNYKNEFGNGEYDEQWLAMHESPEKQKALQWFKEARFGMFIHWGLYSGAAGEWKGTRIKNSSIPGPKVAEWLMFKFQISRDEYAELAKSFNPDKSFAKNIAKLAKEAGMKYVVITSKHHDGFSLFDSKVSEYDTVDATPYKADIVKELYDEVRAEGLEFGVYYSHGNDWADGTDGNYAEVKKTNDALGVFTSYKGKNLWDPSLNTHSEYLESKAYPQIRELVNLLPDLRVLWFDGNGLITEEQAFRFYQLIYKMNPNILVNRRVGYNFGDYLDAGDNVIPSAEDNLNKHWETCGTTNNSWGYNDRDNDWKSTQELLYYFIDIASKGGNYLLNIGPDGQGRVPEQSAQGLREMGAWIKTNHEAIYGTLPWKIQNETENQTLLKGTGHREAQGFSRVFTQQDFWFTTRDKNVYAMSLVQPIGEIMIKSLKTSVGNIKSVKLLGRSIHLNWKQTEEALVIDFTGINTGEHGYAIEALLE